MNLKDASTLALEIAAEASAHKQQAIDRKQIEVWLAQGEDMVFVAAQLPAELGRWYHDGVQQFGAATVVRLLQDNVLQNEPEFPYLARVKLHTVQNYASIYRAILADPRLAGYDVWHVEAVLGVQEGERMVLLNAGRAEQMSIGRFRRYRDEMLGKLPRDNSSEFHDRAQLDELRAANRDVGVAVEEYAIDLATANQYIADLQARLAQVDAADEHPADVAYRRDTPVEWYDGVPICPQCGRRLVCKECGV